MAETVPVEAPVPPLNNATTVQKTAEQPDKVDPCAPEGIVQRILMEIQRVGMAKPVGEMFAGLGSSVSMMVDGKEALQEALLPFFFGDGTQTFDLAVSKDQGMVIGRDAKLEHLGVGEMQAKTSFAEGTAKHKSKTIRAHHLNGNFQFGGFPSVTFIEHTARSVFIQAGSRPDFTAPSLTKALGLGFPAVREMISKIMFMDETASDVSYIKATDPMKPRAVRFEFTGMINIRQLKVVYSSLENIVQHMARATYALVEAPGASVDRTNDNDMEAYLQNAPMFVQLRVRHCSGQRYSLTLTACALEGSNELLWLDQETQTPIKDSKGEFCKVPFDITKRNTFMFRISLHVRLDELGCATFKLPELAFELSNLPRLKPGDSEQFDFKLVYMSGHHRMTLIAMRPFLNLEAFRKVLMRDLSIQINWKPYEQKPNELDQRLGIFDLNFKLRIVPPRSVVTKCVTFFMQTQISKFDVLDFLRDLCSAIGSDFLGLSARS